jgi:hypothetical protein
MDCGSIRLTRLAYSSRWPGMKSVRAMLTTRPNASGRGEQREMSCEDSRNDPAETQGGTLDRAESRAHVASAVGIRSPATVLPDLSPRQASSSHSPCVAAGRDTLHASRIDRFGPGEWCGCGDRESSNFGPEDDLLRTKPQRSFDSCFLGSGRPALVLRAPNAGVAEWSSPDFLPGTVFSQVQTSIDMQPAAAGQSRRQAAIRARSALFGLGSPAAKVCA